MCMKTMAIIAVILFCTATTAKAGVLNSECFNTENGINYQNKSGKLRISLDDGVLCLNARDVSIEEVVGEIVRISGIRGWIFTGGEEKIIIEFHDIPLQQGLEKILKNKNYGISYDLDVDSAGALQVVKPETAPLTTGTTTDIPDAPSPVGGPGVSEKSEKEAGRAVYRRAQREYRVSDAIRNAADIPDVQVWNKNGLSELLKDADANRISALLTEAFETSISNSSSAEAAKIIDKHTTSADGTQGSMSEDVTEQQLVDILLSYIKYVNLYNLSFLDSIK